MSDKLLSSKSYQILTDNSDLIICKIEDDFITFFPSRLVNIESEFKQRMHLSNFISLLDDKFQQKFRESIDTADSSLTSIRFKTLVLANLEFTIKFYREPAYIILVLKQRTENSQLYSELLDYKEKYVELLRSSPLGVGIHRDQKLLFINEYAKEYLELEGIDYVGMPILQFIHPDSLDFVKQRIKKMGHHTIAKDMAKEKWLTAKGNTIFVDVFASPTYYQKQKATQIIFRDITSNEAASAKLKESELRYSNIFDYAPFGILYYDKYTNKTEVNKIGLKILHLSSVSELELLVENDEFFVSIDKKEKYFDMIRHDSTIKDEIIKVIDQLHPKTIQFLLLNGVINRTAEGRLKSYFAFFQDITSKLDMENRLQSYQKIDLIGNLTSGLIHDFNNILSGVVGNLELLSMSETLDNKSRHQLNNIRQGTLRAEGLVNSIKNMMMTSSKKIEYIDIGNRIEEVFSLLRPKFNKNVHIKNHVRKNTYFVRMDVAQFIQIIMNIIINAHDAILEKNDIVNEFISITVKKKTVADYKSYEVAPGEYNIISITNSGAPILSEFKNHLFEPFFTTKHEKSSDRVGIGLFMVRKIVRNVKGSILVNKTPENYTQFQVVLPTAKPPNLGTSQRSAEHSSPQNLYKFLVIDDEKMILSYIRTILEFKGHSVDIATDGYSGIDLFRQNLDKYDCVLLDFILPKLNGIDVITQIKKISPNYKNFIIITGTVDINIGNYVDDIIAIINKPFTHTDLNNAIVKFEQRRRIE